MESVAEPDSVTVRSYSSIDSAAVWSMMEMLSCSLSSGVGVGDTDGVADGGAGDESLLGVGFTGALGSLEGAGESEGATVGSGVADGARVASGVDDGVTEGSTVGSALGATLSTGEADGSIVGAADSTGAEVGSVITSPSARTADGAKTGANVRARKAG